MKWAKPWEQQKKRGQPSHINRNVYGNVANCKPIRNTIYVCMWEKVKESTGKREFHSGNCIKKTPHHRHHHHHIRSQWESIFFLFVCTLSMSRICCSLFILSPCLYSSSLYECIQCVNVTIFYTYQTLFLSVYWIFHTRYVILTVRCDHFPFRWAWEICHCAACFALHFSTFCSFRLCAASPVFIRNISNQTAKKCSCKCSISIVLGD